MKKTWGQSKFCSGLRSVDRCGYLASGDSFASFGREWPAGYWPQAAAEADQAQWDKTIEQFQADLQALQAIVSDPTTDLYAPIPHAPDYTVLREILVVADHNAYHIGEFAILRQVMGIWPAA